MGNVVSSLVMYALQAAWFCQRLIDQDYRENHGSRSKPIMGIHETDLDVFLSKCRTYYLSKRNRHRPIKYEEEESKKKLNHLNREENVLLEGNNPPNLLWSKGADSLHFDYDNFLSRKDQRVSLSGLIIDKNDLDYFLTKSSEFSRNYRKSDSPKTERRKRKKVYYRKRYNPRGGDRPNEVIFPVQNADNRELFLTIDVDDNDLKSCGDSSDFNNKRLHQRKRKRLSMNTLPVEYRNVCDIEEPIGLDHSYFLARRQKSDNFLPIASTDPPDLVLAIKNSDSGYFHPPCDIGIDKVLPGMDNNITKMMMVRDCLTGSSPYHDF